MNEQNRTAWLWSYDSQKRSEHKLVTYAATTSAKNQPSIVGQWGGYITVNIRQPGDDADRFVEILVTAFIITGTSPGADMLAGCRWLGEKGLILLPTVKANKIKTEVLLQSGQGASELQDQRDVQVQAGVGRLAPAVVQLLRAPWPTTVRRQWRSSSSRNRFIAPTWTRYRATTSSWSPRSRT